MTTYLKKLPFRISAPCVDVPIERELAPNPANPRKNFPEQELENLAQSIREKGLLQPLVVRPQVNGGFESWQAKALRAAQRAQLHEVPVLVRELNDRETLEIAIIENVQRSDLNALKRQEPIANLLSNTAIASSNLQTQLERAAVISQTLCGS